ncbi:hypothetical protein DQ04_10111010 [Trypanosoma grayi]|uniref:hypothetical protein n=1 Tax=Trypanosoma grayi TaxID=71804 RepID=UPI0004F49855|nr:hypothetical protein DQ04_10111010 [Trypanosoma grayi]KEG07342.1 hypothetical protein DQ04_10111010 [Trypanosoma grayi]
MVWCPRIFSAAAALLLGHSYCPYTVCANPGGDTGPNEPKERRTSDTLCRAKHEITGIKRKECKTHGATRRGHLRGSEELVLCFFSGGVGWVASRKMLKAAAGVDQENGEERSVSAVQPKRKESGVQKPRVRGCTRKKEATQPCVSVPLLQQPACLYWRWLQAHFGG